MDHKIENEYENLNPFIGRTVSEDKLFIRGKTNKYHNQYKLKIKYHHNQETTRKSIDSDHLTLLSKGKVTTEDQFFKILSESFDKVHPLFYLNSEQRKIVEQKIILQKFEDRWFYFPGCKMITMQEIMHATFYFKEKSIFLITIMFSRTSLQMLLFSDTMVQFFRNVFQQFWWKKIQRDNSKKNFS
jgi:hypothetical protein